MLLRWRKSLKIRNKTNYSFFNLKLCFTPAEIDMNPEIMQTISLLEARLNASLEMARAKHQAQIEQKKVS